MQFSFNLRKTAINSGYLAFSIYNYTLYLVLKNYRETHYGMLNIRYSFKYKEALFSK